MTVTEQFLSIIPSQTRNEILDNVANYYGISRQDALEEVTDIDAEHLLDYVTGATRSATSVLMQRHGFR
jgi:predicted nucleic acid-binding protein